MVNLPAFVKTYSKHNISHCYKLEMAYNSDADSGVATTMSKSCLMLDIIYGVSYKEPFFKLFFLTNRRA